MDRSDEKSLHISIVTVLSTVAANKPQDSRQYALDITNNSDYNNQEFRLPANNAQGDNERSAKLLENIESFVYIYYPYGEDIAVSAIFTRPDYSEFELPLNGVTILNAAFKSVVIINRSTEANVVIKAIYS